MSGKSVRVGVVLGKRGYSGVVTVFNDGLHVWSETTRFVRPTIAEALKDAAARKADLIEEDEQGNVRPAAGESRPGQR